MPAAAAEVPEVMAPPAEAPASVESNVPEVPAPPTDTTVVATENEPSAPVEAKAEAGVTPTGRNWYIVQTFAGQEERVKAKIEKSIKEMGMENRIFSVLVPEEEVVEMKAGKRDSKMKKMYPGYVFIEMDLDEASWYAIRQTPGVARFIGSKISPIPVTDREMKRVLKQLGMKEERVESFFEAGETIRIISGPFRGYTGTVDEINVAKSKLRSLVNIFGRDTPVEVNFDQVEKMT